jgi:hypothetical protein
MKLCSLFPAFSPGELCLFMYAMIPPFIIPSRTADLNTLAKCSSNALDSCHEVCRYRSVRRDTVRERTDR